MKRSILFVGLFAAIVLTSCKKGGTETPPPPPPPPPPETQKDIANVDNAVKNLMTTFNIPGASLAVSENGKLVYVKGYGVSDKTSNEPVTPANQFRLASVSKTFTGAAIMKLVQEGSFSLDDKVFGTGALLGTEYGTPPYNANLSNITVRHLLTNTSGSWGSATGGDVIDQNPGYTAKQFLDWVLNTRSNPKTPGSTYDYSNVGFWIAGRIIEKKSGKSYISYIKENLLATTGADQTDIAGKTEAERKAKEVKYYGQGKDVPYVYNIAFPRRDADGGLIATASDLLRLINAVDGFATRPDILNTASVTAFTTYPSFSTYANGIAIWPAQQVWYNYGSLPGTRTGFMRHNNGTCAALLLNSRVDPTTANETPFVQAMQNVILDLVKNATHPWQSLDQF